MTTKIKTTLLTAFFFFALLTGLQAQDKYEYVMISHVQTQGQKIYIATSSADNYTEDIIHPKSFDMSELIKHVTEYTDKGWEVYNTAYSTQGFQFQTALTYFLRKKKN